MARIKYSSKIGTRSAREALPKRKEPYWHTIEQGRSLGYAKGKKGGSWIARYYDPQAVPKTQQKDLGPADDVSNADGKMVLDFSQAQNAAREWFSVAYHRATGDQVTPKTYTVAHAIQDYLDDAKRKGKKTGDRMRWDFDAHVIAPLGSIPAGKLSQKKIETWLQDLAAKPAKHQARPPETEREKRSRAATVNRIWTNLRSALNLAYRNHAVPSDEGWRRVRPLPGAGNIRLRFLSVDEQRQLADAAHPDDWRRLILAGLFTGCRVGELLRLEARDFHPEDKVIFILDSKNGRSRYVHLTMEGARFFSECASDLPAASKIFPRLSYDRKPTSPAGTWSSPELSRMMRDTCIAAKLQPVVFHELRHTYASTWRRKGMSLSFLAEQLGHTSIKMVEKHYGHITKDDTADAVRNADFRLGIIEE